MFGQSTFGSSGAGGFGQPPASSNPFGSPPPAPAFGGGSPPAATPFGGGTAAPAAGGTPFGSFGAAPAPSGGGLFGGAAAAPSGGGLFGAPAPSLFGGTATAPAPSIFGAPSATTTPFGGTTAAAPAPGGLFGSPPAPAPGGLFGGVGGTSSATGLFGAPAPSPTAAFGMPGSATASAAPGTGTGLTPFAPTARADGANQIYLHSITAMPAYENSSFEELRVQDYSSGNRGSAANTPTASGSGGGTFSFGGMGGAPAPGGLFGGLAPAPGLFGSSGTGGSTGLFGSSSTAAAPAGSTLFGGGAPSPSPFGAAPAPSAFGAAPAPAGFFGAPAPAPSAGFFGAPAPAPGGAFGSTGFGSTAPAPAGGTGLFGSTTAPAPFGGGGFGAPSPAPSTTGGFGSTGLFGSSPTPAPAPFGGGFGSPAPAPSAFGGGSAFGSTPAPAPAFGGFGTAAPAPFGSAPAPGGTGLFGSATAPAPPPAFGGFGSTTAAPAPSLFGSPAPAPTTSLFGGPAPAPASFFGSPAAAPASSLFGGGGASSAPSLFGPPPAAAPAPSTFGFGAPSAPATSLFGAASQPSPWGSSPAPPIGPPVAGSVMAVPYVASVPPNTHIMPPLVGDVLEQQLRALNAQREALEKSQVWMAPPPSSPSSAAATTPVNLSSSSAYAGGGGGSWAAFSFPAGSPPTPRSSATRIRPRGMGGAGSTRSEPRARPTGGGAAGRWWNPDESSPRGSVSAANAAPLTPETYWNASATRLTIRPESASAKKKPLRLQWAAEQLAAADAAAAKDIGTPNATAALPSAAPAAPAAGAGGTAIPSPVAGDTITPPPPDEPLNITATREREPRSSPATSGATATAAPAARKDPGYDYYQRTLGSGLEAPTSPVPTAPAPAPSPASSSAQNLAPTLTKPGYDVQPPIETLQGHSEVELAAVQGFCVTRPSFGRVEWIGAVDVRGANLDDIVDIQHGDISVYSLDEANGTKPPEGSKLNRPAILTFYDLYPTAGGAHAPPEEFDKLQRKLEKSARKAGAEFMSYDVNLGEWKIRVQHFSHYGVMDDEEDEDDAPINAIMSEEGANVTSPEPPPTTTEVVKRVRLQVPTPTMPAHAALKRQATPYKSPRGRLHVMVEDVDNESEEDVEDQTMEDLTTEDGIRRVVSSRAAATYQQVYDRHHTPDGLSVSPEKPKAVVTFERIGEVSDQPLTMKEQSSIASPVYNQLVASAALHPSISRRMANARGLEKSSIDLGWSKRQSFRVGWLPNGSFLKVEGTILTEVRPDYDTTALPQRLLETHLKHSTRDTTGTFSFPSIENNSDGVKTAIDELSRDASSFPEASSSFTLLSSQLHARSESQIVTALTHLLLNATAVDIARDVQKGIVQSNAPAGVAAAVLSGDVVRASEAAASAGMFGLASVLSTWNTSSKADILQQVRMAASQGDLNKMPPDILLILKAICGDDAAAEARGDWRQRVAFRLRQNPDATLNQLAKGYEDDRQHGLVPFPFPSGRTDDRAPSALYQVMLALADPSAVSLAEVIDPQSLAVDRHDYSLSFHLATGISAVTSLSLPPLVAEKLIDSYATQLVDCGRWEWAVFVVLCCFSGSPSNEARRAKLSRAKQLVLRYYHNCDSAAKFRRKFLEEKLSIPSEWFEEALAHRAGYQGSIDQCVVHLTDCDPKNAVLLLEELCLPSIFFLDSKGIAKSMGIFQAAKDLDPDSLAAAMDQYFRLDNYLSRMTDDQVASDLLALKDVADNLETLMRLRLLQQRSVTKKILLPVATTRQTIPLSAMLASALERLKVHKIRIRAMLASF